ncbi:hypothetical protein ACFX1X_023718 [Malus domestica]
MLSGRRERESRRWVVRVPGFSRSRILDDPSPTPSKHQFSPEFCSFIEACLQKDADERPTAEQLLSHPFITKYEDSQVNIGAFARSVFDPTQRMKDLADRSSSSMQLRNSKTSKLERLNIKSSTVHAIKTKSVRIKDIVDEKRTNGKLKIVVPDCLVRRINEFEFDFPSAKASYREMNSGIDTGAVLNVVRERESESVDGIIGARK